MLIFAVADQRFHAKAITDFIPKRSVFSADGDHGFSRDPDQLANRRCPSRRTYSPNISFAFEMQADMRKNKVRNH